MIANDLDFRIAVATDAARLGDFMSRNFLAAYGHCSTPENVHRAVADYYGEAAQLRQITDPARWNLIVCQGQDWLGHAQLRDEPGSPGDGNGGRRTVELARFYVDAGHHGRGIAQAMMAAVKTEARRRGASAICLSVWQEAPQAIRFYEKEGFAVAGQTVFMVGDDAKDDWLMRCELG